MLFWKMKQKPPVSATPADEVAALGPVARHNHIAYAPAPSWSGVPGCGVANLAYLPDFLLSAPEYYAGNAIPTNPNAIMIAIPPAFVDSPKTVLDGIGGLTAGQVVSQPLLQVNINNDNTTAI